VPCAEKEPAGTRLTLAGYNSNDIGKKQGNAPSCGNYNIPGQSCDTKVAASHGLKLFE
jgi:hypothetical protein